MSSELEPHSCKITVLAADHPSLSRELDRFLADLRSEHRYFGPSASANPKPFPSLIDALGGGDGFRLAAVEQGRIIGVARVDADGQLFLAVVCDRRGTGVGTILGRAALERASALEYRRIVLRSTRRSRAARRVGEQLGCVVVERSRGRTDMILDPATIRSGRRSA